MQGDGDGWVECSLGHRHWGRFGAAGLLLHTSVDGARPRPAAAPRRLVPPRRDVGHSRRRQRQPRVDAEQPHCARRRRRPVSTPTRCWCTARSSTTTAAGPTPPCSPPSTARSTRCPTTRARSCAGSRSTRRPAWTCTPASAPPGPSLRATALHVVVDTANVVGSTPDGWWRDRRAATTSAARTDSPAWSPGWSPCPTGEDAVVASVTAVLEGAARAAVAPSGVGSCGPTLVATTRSSAWSLTWSSSRVRRPPP